MSSSVWFWVERCQKWLRQTLVGPQILAFLPACALGAFWLSGEGALVIVALGVPLLFALGGGFQSEVVHQIDKRDSVTGLIHRNEFEARLDAVLEQAESFDRKSACFAFIVDDYAHIAKKYGDEVSEMLLTSISNRLQAKMRDNELVSRSGECRFSAALAPVRNLDLETCIQLASRLQAAVEEPFAIDGATIYASCSVGFCLSNRAPKSGGGALHKAANIALKEAMRNGPSAIRSYSEEIRQIESRREALFEDVNQALDTHQFRAWFQPQVSTDTGQITGFETLARWNHPARGMVSPGEFLPALERNGQLERLGETMLDQALEALSKWDAAKIDVPRIGVNFTQDELKNPRLVEKVEWALDRHNIKASRLCIEVLETVVATDPDDIIARNIRGLSDLGCAIDLDDFGTGSTSISSLRKFPISRLKIDRSFVMRADQSEEQQRMISAILTMAERLELNILAEGIETVGEHAMVAQLGCGNVQGFGIGRPMPFEQTLDWIHHHNSQLAEPPAIGRKAGQ